MGDHFPGNRMPKNQSLLCYQHAKLRRNRQELLSYPAHKQTDRQTGRQTSTHIHTEAY